MTNISHLFKTNPGRLRHLKVSPHLVSDNRGGDTSTWISLLLRFGFKMCLKIKNDPFLCLTWCIKVTLQPETLNKLKSKAKHSPSLFSGIKAKSVSL